VPTYVDALFGHSGGLRDLPGFLPIGEDPPVLEGPDTRLYLYARVALLHHPGLKWWDFVQGERGRARERARELAGRFGATRIVYLADGLGVVADGGDDDLPAIEAFLGERRGPPTPWDAPPPSKEAFRSAWFREDC
jgi:hypothetical protein